MLEDSNIIPASEIPNKLIPRVSSGIFVFDALTSGGLPLWKYIIFHGNKSCGKTTISLKIMDSFLSKYPDKYVAYIDFEDSFDKLWASNFIKESNMERLLVIVPDYGEQGVDYAINCAKDESVGFIFVDSLAEMIPTVEADKSALDETMGLQAKLMNKMFRKLLPIMSMAKKQQRPLVYLFINQERSNFNARAFQASTQKPGGYFQNFIASLDVRFYLVSKDTATESKASNYGDFKFKIDKSKVSGILPYRSGLFRMQLLDNPGFVDNVPSILMYAKKYKLITKEKSEYLIGDNRFSNQIQIVEYLSQIPHPPEYFEYYNKLVELL